VEVRAAERSGRRTQGLHHTEDTGDDLAVDSACNDEFTLLRVSLD
jgi:hypothetical protein